MLRLTIIEQPDGDKPDSAMIIVGPGGAIVGRTRENTWVLPDQQNLLSRAHFEVLFENGAYRLLDRSTNGTFINEQPAPIGRGKSIPIQDGDVIGLGEYKIKVTLEAIGSEAEPMLGGRPDFFGADSLEAPADIDAPPFIPDTDPMGFSDAGEIPDAFAAIEPQQIPDGLFGDSSNFSSGGSVASADLPDMGVGRPAVNASTDGRSDIDSSFGSPQFADIGSEGEARPDLFVPVVAPAESTPMPSTPYLSMPVPDEEHVHDASNMVAPQPAIIEKENASGAIPDDWYLEPEEPAFVAPAVSSPEPVATPPPPLSGAIVSVDRTPEPTPEPSVPAAAPPAQPSAGDHELERGIRQAVAGALGEQAETMGLAELVRVVEEMSAMVQASTPELMRALNSRTQFKDHMRLDQTMVMAQDNNPLRFCAKPSDALVRMLLNDQPGMLKGRLAVAEAFHQLAAHQTALIAALQPALEETVENFSPASIEALVGKDGGIGFHLSLGKGKLWDAYEKVFAKFTASDRGRLEDFFMKSLAMHYDRSVKKLG